jgi:hypothetical protein
MAAGVLFQPLKLMRTVNLLTGNSDRALNQRLEAVVLDACYNQAAVECVRTPRMDDFVRQGCSGGFQLIVLVSGDLLPAPGRRGSFVSRDELLEAIRSIRQRSSAAIIVISALPDDELPLLEAGVESVLPLPLNCEQLGAEVRRVLRLAEPVHEEAPDRGSLAAALLRGWRRLKSA